MKKTILFGFVLGFALLGRAAAQGTFDHSAYDQLLGKYVRRGIVDYATWKVKDQQPLVLYLNRVAAANVEKFKTREEKLAFYLNAYNAIVIAQVIENLPMKSPKDVKGFNDRLKHLVGSKPYTLDELLKKIRTDFPDPRVVFALNSGALGDPPMSSHAFRGDSLDAQVQVATASFLASPKNVRLDKKAKILYVSRIFDWNEKDFEASTGSVRNFLKLNMPEEFRLALEAESYELKYLPFDWSLNGTSGS
jgi:hypothetical protein